MADCLFCGIAAGVIPSTKVYEDDQILAFRDINPQGPVHVLFIPKKHIGSALDITAENSAVIAHIFEVAAQVARDEGIAADGYRLVSNIGEYGQQSVHHLHLHMIGGRQMSWPPG